MAIKSICDICRDPSDDRVAGTPYAELSLYRGKDNHKWSDLCAGCCAEIGRFVERLSARPAVASDPRG